VALEALCRVAAREKFSARRSCIEGFRYLVVEDDYALASDATERLNDLGAEVLGPVPSVIQALDLVERGSGFDGALLDINLDGDTVYPVAGVLRMKQIPFVFLTGYEQRVLPPAYSLDGGLQEAHRLG
jgi:CheY-like chemotaxis protein